MKKDNKIADTELEIMKAVWKRPCPVSSSDIIKELTVTRGWKETTIYTLISRLVEKHFLTQKKQKQVSYYSPTVSEHDYALGQTQDFIDKLFGGDAKQLVSMLYGSKKISEEEIEKLRVEWEDEIEHE